MDSQKDTLIRKWNLVSQKGITIDSNLIEKLQIELIFLASNFEGLKLTHKQAEKVVKDPQMKIGENDKSLLQAKGQKVALDFAEEYAGKGQPLDIYIIKDIHKMILEEAWPEEAGEYRKEEVRFKKTRFRPPHYTKVPEEMFFFDKWLLERQENIKEEDIWEVLQFATESFHKLTHIHPFRDGNGRVARIVFNLICRRYRLPYVLIPKSGYEERFLKSLENADFGDAEPLTEVMAGFTLKSLDIMLRRA